MSSLSSLESLEKHLKGLMIELEIKAKAGFGETSINETLDRINELKAMITELRRIKNN